ncbi:protein ITPRID2 isoform X2 [Pristis pectinata]|uniref:protein ITPRID2 isoform X2 n=1 Tax=Pristis pectinata TaxID=685728 RepID=UPI00223E3024|nr:protein ITPRID2 isoform X2 [Pristis pectinata]
MEGSPPQLPPTWDKNTSRKRRAWAQSRGQWQNVEENLAGTASGPGTVSRKPSQPMLSCISQILEFYKEDPEDILYNLGFGMEEPNITAKIPSRFFSYTSHAKGINFRVFLEAQVKRLGEENPSYTLASRFRQIEVLTTMANALTSLYSRVSKTPVTKIGPVHEFSFSPDKSNKWQEGKLPGGKAVQKLRKTITKLCLYGAPKEMEYSKQKKEFASKMASGLDQSQECTMKTDCVRTEPQGSGEVCEQAFSSRDSERSESPCPKEEESQHANDAMTKETLNVDTGRSKHRPVSTKAHQTPEIEIPNEQLECSNPVPSPPERDAVSNSGGSEEQHVDTQEQTHLTISPEQP